MLFGGGNAVNWLLIPSFDLWAGLSSPNVGVPLAGTSSGEPFRYADCTLSKFHKRRHNHNIPFIVFFSCVESLYLYLLHLRHPLHPSYNNINEGCRFKIRYPDLLRGSCLTQIHNSIVFPPRQNFRYPQPTRNPRGIGKTTSRVDFETILLL